MADTVIPTPHGEMPAYYAEPTTPGPWPGVVVIHDVFGMTHDLRGQCDWLAREGFAAVGPNLYYWRGKLSCIRSTIKEMTTRRGRSFDEVDAARDWLSARGSVKGKPGVIGFCMGGGFALLLAEGHGFGASSVNYGRIPDDIDRLLDGACPIVGSFGKNDRQLRGAADKLDRALTARGIPHDVKEYEGAAHAFLNEHDPNDIFVVLRVLLRWTGAGYHEPSARDARARIVRFFKTHLSDASATT